MKKDVKKILIFGASLLTLSSVGINISNVQVSANRNSIKVTYLLNKKRRLRNQINRDKNNISDINIEINRLKNKHASSEHHLSYSRKLYKLGEKNGYTFANNWLDSSKPNGVEMIAHLAKNHLYYKGWMKAMVPYAGSRKQAKAMFNALNNPSLGLYQTDRRFIKK